MSSSDFIVGNKYSRKDIFRILSILPEPTGGNWFTGYTSYNDELFVFVNIETEGRTGHFYGDYWQEDGSLYWYGKTGSHSAQPTIVKMLDPANKVHFFTRDDNRDIHFVYQGIGLAETVYPNSPIEVVWRFHQ